MISRRALFLYGTLFGGSAGIAGSNYGIRDDKTGKRSFIIGQRILLDTGTLIKDAIIRDCHFTVAYDVSSLVPLFENCDISRCRFEWAPRASDYNSEWRFKRYIKT
jgi:hypothetical protein